MTTIPGLDAPLTDPRPARLRVMHKMYGRDPAHACGSCRHLIARHYSKVYYKCGLTRLTCGPQTDWRMRWEACGKYEEGEPTDECRLP